MSININIVFTKPRVLFAPISWLIRLFDKAPYSHVYVEYYEELVGGYIAFEANSKTARFIRPGGQKDIIVDSKSISINDDQLKALKRLCFLMAGTQYGFLQILGIMVYKILPRRGNPFPNNSKQLVCSEVVLKILQQVFQIGKDLDPDTVSPKDVYILLQKTLF